MNPIIKGITYFTAQGKRITGVRYDRADNPTQAVFFFADQTSATRHLPHCTPALSQQWWRGAAEWVRRVGQIPLG